MSTSYERVYEALLKTPAAKEVWNAALKKIDDFKYTGVEWQLRIGTDSVRMEARLCFSTGTRFEEDRIGSLEIRASECISSPAVDKIIADNFGPNKPVKTFNCSKYIVERGGNVSRKTKYGRSPYQDSFLDYFHKSFQNETFDRRLAAVNRVKAELQQMIQTEAFRQARHEACVAGCKETIARALLPWHGMEEKVLQDAWNQFICMTITET